MFEEIEYVDGGDLAIFNGYSFRRDKNTGYYLSSKPIGTKRKRLHVYVWEFFSGMDLPKGYEIHHVDRDKNNNTPENLMLVQGVTHRRVHGHDNMEARRKHMDEKVRPAAIAWHKSEAGRKWHSEHAKEQFAKLEPVTFTCDNCGKEFETMKRKKEGNHFCSNNCKSAYRRKSGVDDVDKICQECGKTFRANKYQKVKRCPDCRSKKR